MYLEYQLETMKNFLYQNRILSELLSSSKKNETEILHNRLVLKNVQESHYVLSILFFINILFQLYIILFK